MGMDGHAQSSAPYPQALLLPQVRDEPSPKSRPSSFLAECLQGPVAGCACPSTEGNTRRRSSSHSRAFQAFPLVGRHRSSQRVVGRCTSYPRTRRPFGRRRQTRPLSCWPPTGGPRDCLSDLAAILHIGTEKAKQLRRMCAGMTR